MTKALLLTINFPPSVGGMERYYADLAASFPGHSICVSTPRMAGAGDFDAKATYEIRRPPIPRRKAHLFVFALFWFGHVLVECFKNRYDVLLCGNVTPVGWICRWVSRIRGIPYVIFFHGMDVERVARKLAKPGPQARALEKTLAEARICFANSRDTARRLQAAGVAAGKIRLLYPAVDCNFFSPGTSPSLEPVVLTVGRYAERKGVDLLVRAVARIRERVPAVRLVIVGRGQTEVLGPLVRDLRATSFVEFHGEVSLEDLRAHYRRARLFAMPSWEDEGTGSVEGFGIVYLEAAACGVPSLGGRSGGIEDAIEEGVTGFLVNPKDKDELEARLVQLLTEDALRLRQGERARERVTQEFSLESFGPRLATELRKSIPL